MKKKGLVISNLVLFEAFLAATNKDIIFAQQYDLPPHSFRDTINSDFTLQEGLTLEQHFSSYHYQDLGFSDVYDELGIKLFSAKELKYLLNKEIPFEYTKTFNDLRSSKNKPVFDARDIVKFYENDISMKDLFKVMGKVKEVSRKPMIVELYKRKYKQWKKAFDDQNYIFNNKENFKTLYSLSLVKRSYSYFTDTDKPNLLLTYPLLDNPKAFFSPSAREMIKTLSAHYDIWIATVANESELYKAIRKTPNIDLLILSGHGSKDNIMLNIPKEGFEELSYIDVGDKELKRYLKRLNKNATIFLNSCSTGMGGKETNNLANEIARLAPGHKVIAATESFSAQEINIINPFPLEIEIPDKTYIVSKDK